MFFNTTQGAGGGRGEGRAKHKYSVRARVRRLWTALPPLLRGATAASALLERLETAAALTADERRVTAACAGTLSGSAHPPAVTRAQLTAAAAACEAVEDEGGGSGGESEGSGDDGRSEGEE